MVAVVQLVEHQVVILGVAGSSPVSHPESARGLYKQVAGHIAFDGRYVKPRIVPGAFDERGTFFMDRRRDLGKHMC